MCMLAVTRPQQSSAWFFTDVVFSTSVSRSIELVIESVGCPTHSY